MISKGGSRDVSFAGVVGTDERTYMIVATILRVWGMCLNSVR